VHFLAVALHGHLVWEGGCTSLLPLHEHLSPSTLALQWSRSGACPSGSRAWTLQGGFSTCLVSPLNLSMLQSGAVLDWS